MFVIYRNNLCKNMQEQKYARMHVCKIPKSIYKVIECNTNTLYIKCTLT